MALVNDGAGLSGGGGGQLPGNLHSVQILDAAAAGAYEVNVGIDVSIVALHTVHGAKTDDLALGFEQGDVAVDRPEGQVGDLRLQGCVDRFS